MLILSFNQSNTVFSYYIQILHKCFCGKISVANVDKEVKLKNTEGERESPKN